MAAPFDRNTAEAASISSSIGKDSLAGTPRVKLIVSISLDLTRGKGAGGRMRGRDTRGGEPRLPHLRPTQHLQPGGKLMRALVVAVLVGTAFVAVSSSQTAQDSRLSDSLERSFQ